MGSDDLNKDVKKVTDDKNKVYESMKEVSMSSLISRVDPLAGLSNKITPDHIDKILDRDSKVNDYIHKERMTNIKNNKFFWVFSIIALVGLFVFSTLTILHNYPNIFK